MHQSAEPPDLATLYRTHVRDVARWAERLAGPGFDLPDIVHEVFEIAQRRLPSFRAESSAATWLFGITEKVVRHRRRVDRLRHWLSWSGKDQTKQFPAPDPSQMERLEQSERIALVYRVLDRLSQQDRKMLILFELEELPGEQLAALLGIRVQAVWLRLHRARKRFLKVYQEVEGEMGWAGNLARQADDRRYGHAEK
jgi:RNA polymerase sigma-70 factor (ECF subfamily)